VEDVSSQQTFDLLSVKLRAEKKWRISLATTAPLDAGMTAAMLP
jgi:hypothetical protein